MSDWDGSVLNISKVTTTNSLSQYSPATFLNLWAGIVARPAWSHTAHRPQYTRRVVSPSEKIKPPEPPLHRRRNEHCRRNQIRVELGQRRRVEERQRGLSISMAPTSHQPRCSVFPTPARHPCLASPWLPRILSTRHLSPSRAAHPATGEPALSRYKCASRSPPSRCILFSSQQRSTPNLHVRMPDRAQLLERVFRQLEQRPPVLVPRLQRAERRVKDEECNRRPVILVSATPIRRRTFLTPSLISQIVLPASTPGMRSPMVKGNDTPVLLSTEEVIDLR